MFNWFDQRKSLAPKPMVAISSLIEVSSCQAESASSDLDVLLEDYMILLRQVNGLVGLELRSAADRITELALEIDRIAPGFDWLELWQQEGIIPFADSGAIEHGPESRTVRATTTQEALDGSPSDFVPATLPREAPRTFLDRFSAGVISDDFGAAAAARLGEIADYHDSANAWDRVTFRAKFWATWMAAARDAKVRHFESGSIPYLFSWGEDADPEG